MEHSFKPLEITDWEDSKKTLHLFLQIVGKIRGKLMPRKNHWWNVTLYVSAKGLTTRPIPYRDKSFEIEFNFIDHTLEIRVCDGQQKSFKLQDGLSVSEFYKNVMNSLKELGIEVKILAKPYDNLSKEPFEENTSYKSYDAEFVRRYWDILRLVNSTFEEFSGKFLGKTCPVQLYWHHMDLTVTRFSGKRGPEMPEAGIVEKEAYSHEVISFGFWPGDETVRFPAFYSYTYPAPAGIDQKKLEPASARWVDSNNSPMAILSYNELIKEEKPERALLSFLESAYYAGASAANWNIQDFDNSKV
ncbi:MAG: DUF5996 family protein [Daejeonella sp.]